MNKIGKMQSNLERVGLPPFPVMNRNVLNKMLDVQQPVLPYAARATIRSQLRMEAETNAPPAVTISTNAPTATATNAVENVPAIPPRNDSTAAAASRSVVPT